MCYSTKLPAGLTCVFKVSLEGSSRQTDRLKIISQIHYFSRMSVQDAQRHMAYLRVVFSSTVVPIGMTGNLVAWYIFSQKALNSKDSRHGHMNGLLCFFNMLALSSSVFITQFLPFFGISLNKISDSSCKIVNLWLRFTLQVPSCHQCLVTFLFYLSIRYPSRSKFMYEKKFIARCMIIMCVFIIVVNIEYFWYFLQYTYTTTTYHDSVSNQTVNITIEATRTCGSDYLTGMAADYIHILMRVFIPFFILFFFNTLILRIVSKTKRNISDPRAVLNNSTNKTANEVRFGRILIFLNFLFLVMFLPWAMSFIISNSLTSQGVRFTNLIDGANDPQLIYFYNISYCLSFCYNASPCFVNLSKNLIMILSVCQLKPFF